MASSAYQIPCYLPSGGQARDYVLKMEKNGGVCFRGRGVFSESFGSTVLKVNQKQLFYVRCLEGPNGDLEDKRRNEIPAQMDEYTLEAELQAAINSENYAKAARLRDELRALQEDSKAGVVAANSKFYKAFELGDLKLMRSIWASGDNVHCIHPGAGRISGHDMVMASWELMLGPEIASPLKIELHNMEVQVKGSLAYVTCLEVVRTSGASWGKQLATNVFEKQNGSWCICMHHASHFTL